MASQADEKELGPVSPSPSVSSSDLEQQSVPSEVFAPITSSASRDMHWQPQPQEKQSSNPTACAAANTSRSLERSWSLNDGTSFVGNEDGEGERVPDEMGDEGYTVYWENGELLNPRNMSKARKWMVVIIVSMGSLCV